MEEIPHGFPRYSSWCHCLLKLQKYKHYFALDQTYHTPPPWPPNNMNGCRILEFARTLSIHHVQLAQNIVGVVKRAGYFIQIFFKYE